MTWTGAPRPAGITLAQTVALVLPFAIVASSDVGRHALILLSAFIAALGWEALFGTLRKRGLSVHGVTTALIVATLCPPDIALWQVLVSVSLGVILGELVFGGRGFGFIHPATVSLALLMISFPQVQLPLPTQALALATLPGGVLLFTLGLISGRVLLATGLAVAAALVLQGHAIEPLAVATALAFGLVFLVADPVTAAATNVGRWAYGALAGGLIAIFSPTGEITSQAVIFAALMAGVFAPLIDHLAVLAHAYRWQRRHRA
ncbi:MAG: RnfABCDGE type electron transport complex subunit D [Paracoccaceae bacterium]|nr:RnfABCDGE type electron transport complex subunit D [Paracoccaceae bacterium]